MNDRDEILAVMARYDVAAAQRDYAALAATFATHGVLQSDGKTFRGRAGIHRALEGLRRRPSVAGSPAWPGAVTRTVESSRITFLNASEALVHSAFVGTSPTGPDHTGYYEDRFVYDASQRTWLIAHRAVRIGTAARSSAARAGTRRSRRAAVLATTRPAIAGPAVARR